VAAARVGRLATVTADGRPHVVPCCFALDGDVVYTAVDDVKAKSTMALRRLDNIRTHPDVALLVDHYDDDWSALWWVRLDGRARIESPGSATHAAGVAALTAKYEPYRARPLAGAMIVIDIAAWRTWP